MIRSPLETKTKINLTTVTLRPEVILSVNRILLRRPRRAYADMAVLPTAAALVSHENLYHSPNGGLSNSVPLIFRRLHRFQQMVCCRASSLFTPHLT